MLMPDVSVQSSIAFWCPINGYEANATAFERLFQMTKIPKTPRKYKIQWLFSQNSFVVPLGYDEIFSHNYYILSLCKFLYGVQ